MLRQALIDICLCAVTGWLAGWLYTRLSRNAMTGPRVAHTAGGKNESCTEVGSWICGSEGKSGAEFVGAQARALAQRPIAHH